MPADKTIDTVLLILALGCLTLGLGSVALGWAVRQWDRLMSRYTAPVPDQDTIKTEHRSEAREPRGNGVEPTAETVFRSTIVYLEQCDDDLLLDILAQLTNADGDYRFAESRVAKFIPGRVEDRLAQVRAIRDTVPPPPPGRQLRVRDEQGERMIPMQP